MKKLEMTDRFECTPTEFWSNFFDPSFVAAVDAEIGFKGRQELMFVDNDEKIQTRCRVTPKGEVPPHIQQMLNNSLKMLQQVISSGQDLKQVPEPMRKMIEWGKSTFKDILSRDSKVPAPAPKITMEYLDDALFEKKSGVLRWTITPEIFKDVSSFKGSMTVIAEGTGCIRTIDGEFNLGVPGAGEMLETFLIGEIQKNQQKVADVTHRFLKEKKIQQT